MVLVDVAELESPVEVASQPFPAEVEFVISALEAGPRPLHERQKRKRMRYRVRATLKLYSDEAGTPPTVLYTRHVNGQALGFLSDRPLALSHGGILRLISPQGQMMQIACTILRCREAAPGWYEGAVYFNREQPLFDADAFV